MITHPELFKLKQMLDTEHCLNICRSAKQVITTELYKSCADECFELINLIVKDMYTDATETANIRDIGSFLRDMVLVSEYKIDITQFGNYFLGDVFYLIAPQDSQEYKSYIYNVFKPSGRVLIKTFEHWPAANRYGFTVTDMPLILSQLPVMSELDWQIEVNARKFFEDAYSIVYALNVHIKDEQLKTEFALMAMPFFQCVNTDIKTHSVLYELAELLYGLKANTVIATARSLGLANNPEYWKEQYKPDCVVSLSLPEIF